MLIKFFQNFFLLFFFFLFLFLFFFAGYSYEIAIFLTARCVLLSLFARTASNILRSTTVRFIEIWVRAF